MPIRWRLWRDQARRTARNYSWDEVIKNLIEKLEYQGRRQGILDYQEPERAELAEDEPEAALAESV